MRKAITLVLLIVLLVSSIPMQAQAAYENTYVNTGDQRADIIGVALTQMGYTEGSNNDTKYGDWAGHSNTPWCGWFVSWCARQAGIPTSVLKTTGLANPSNFGLTSYYTIDQYTPRPGDLFFKKNFGHVGIVYYVDGNYFYTLEGNTSTTTYDGIMVMSRRRALNEFYFAAPAYTSDSGSSGGPPPHTHNHQQGYENSHPHKEYYKCACGDSYYTGETRTVSGCSTCTQSSCDHSYGSWSSNGNSSHKKTCSKCGYRQTQDHRWQDEAIAKEPTCKDAGKKSQRCSVCNATRTQTIAKLDEHIYKDWVVADEENHKRICEYCEDEQVQPHVLMVDEQEAPVWQKDELNHWYQCADCGQKEQSAAHTLKTDFDEQGHWQYCEICQNILPKQTHVFDHGCDKDCADCGYTRQTEHVYAELISKDAENHWYDCVNCGDRKDLTPHRYQLIPWEDGTEVESCMDCQHLSGKVVVKDEWELFLQAASDELTKLGKLILQREVESKWYLITGGSACVLALVILVTVFCLTIRGIRKHRRFKQAV